MNAKQAQAVKGKYGIIQIGDRFDSGRIRDLSPSGNFVEVDWAWQRVENVTFVEELPEPPAEVPAPYTAAAVQGADLAATNQKLQEENTSLTGQIAQARKEVEALKAALMAQTGGTTGTPPLSFPTGS